MAIVAWNHPAGAAVRCTEVASTGQTSSHAPVNCVFVGGRLTTDCRSAEQISDVRLRLGAEKSDKSFSGGGGGDGGGFLLPVPVPTAVGYSARSRNTSANFTSGAQRRLTAARKIRKRRPTLNTNYI